MSDKSAPRPGGRSARIQAAVHQAVRDLQQEHGRDGLTVPVIASRAGVTPSTIYRRWGDITQLLADVAVEQLQPEQAPADTGSFRSDMLAWLLQYFEEISSAPGRAMLRDVLGSEFHGLGWKCDGFLRQHMETIIKRALGRGEKTVSADVIVNMVVAPLIYRMLFVNETPTAQAVEAFFEQAIRTGHN